MKRVIDNARGISSGLCVLALLTASAAGAQGTGVDSYEVLESRILQGGIVESREGVADVIACAAVCDAEGYCNSFTFIPSRSICELKREAAFADGSYSGYVSGVKRANSIRELIANIATGHVREAPAVKHDSQVVGTSPPEHKRGRTRPDGTAQGFVCREETVRLEQAAEEFVTLNPTQEWLYPGALLQGATIASGTPTWIPAARAPGRISLALQTGEDTSYVESLSSMSRADAIEGANRLLSRYRGGTPGEISLRLEEVHSQEHLEAELGVNVTGTNFSGGASMNMNFDEEKTRIVVRVVQKYYTLVFEPPRFPDEVFADDVSVSELDRWMGPGNPPVYVSSVNYGRMLFVLLESDMSAQELRAAFNASYNSIVSAEAEGSADYRSTIENTNISVVSFGASGQGGLSAAADIAEFRSLEGLYRFLRTSGDFSLTNPGVPISYHMRSLFDSRPVRLAATTEYTKNTCQPAVFGCDGDPGSGLALDQCGVCGGSDACKQDCPARTVSRNNSGHAWVEFDLPATPIGQTQRYDDGRYWVGRGLRCYSVTWSNVRFSCVGSDRGGRWQDSGSFTNEAWCHGESNTDQDGMRVFKR